MIGILSWWKHRQQLQCMDASSAATEMLPATIQWHHGDVPTSKSWDHALATNHLPSPSRRAGGSEHNKRPRLFPKRGKSDDFIQLLKTSHHHHLYNRPEKKQYFLLPIKRPNATSPTFPMAQSATRRDLPAKKPLLSAAIPIGTGASTPSWAQKTSSGDYAHTEMLPYFLHSETLSVSHSTAVFLRGLCRQPQICNCHWRSFRGYVCPIVNSAALSSNHSLFATDWQLHCCPRECAPTARRSRLTRHGKQHK